MKPIKIQVKLTEFLKDFNIVPDNWDAILDKSKERFLESPSITRAGLELSKHFLDDTRISKEIVLWGTTEQKWFDLIGLEQTKTNIENIFKHKPPLLFLSKGITQNTYEIILELANLYNVPIVYHKTMHSSKIFLNYGSYLINKFSPIIQVHGSLVQIGGTGVLIVGESGIGKSEATLELIQRGHIFVSDDAVLISENGTLFIGHSPKITKNLLEVRGIGIIDVKYTYGIRSVTNSAIINLVIELVNSNIEHQLDRLGYNILEYPILNRSIRKIQIAIKGGSSAASLIEAAVSAYLARCDGYDIINEMEKRRIKNDTSD